MVTQKCPTTTPNKFSWKMLELSTFKNLGIWGFQTHLRDWNVNSNTPNLMQSLITFPEIFCLTPNKNIIIYLDFEDFYQELSIYKETSTLVLHTVQYPAEGRLKRRGVIFVVFIERCLYTEGTDALMLSQVNPNKPCSSINKQFNSPNLNYIITHQ